VEQKWLQLALGSLGLLVWLGLYLAARFANCEVRQWRTPVLWSVYVLFAFWTLCWVIDRPHIGSVLQMNFFGFFLASNWLNRRYGSPYPTITRLNLSDDPATGDDTPNSILQQRPPA
jgi:hypothetical protein